MLFGGRVMENLTSEYFNVNVSENLPGLLGLNVTKVGRGSMELELEVKKKHLAINGYLHAGTIVSLADTAAGNGCMANLPDRAIGFTTIELKSNLINTVRSGKIICSSKCLHAGRTTQVWESKVMEAETQTLIAAFTCTQLVLYPKK
jgi:1,4-dihydroxy-2-naphthoyl-CoA hydrolase